MCVVYSIASKVIAILLFFFSSRRRHTRLQGDWSSDVCSSDLKPSSPWLPRGTYASSTGCQEEKTPKFMRKRPENSWRQVNSQGICCPMVYRLALHARPLSATATRFWQCLVPTANQNSDRVRRLLLPTDGLGLERIGRKGGMEIAERGQEYFRRKLDVRTLRPVGVPSSTNPANKLILLRIDNGMAKTAGSTAVPSQDSR